MTPSLPPAAAWVHANERRIAAMHDRHRRTQAQREFARAVERLHADSRLSVPPDLVATARRELAVPGRYQLKMRVVRPRASIWEIAWGWLSDQFNRLYSALRARVHVGRSGAFALGDAIVAIAALIVIVTAVRLAQSMMWERRRSSFGRALSSPPDAETLLASARDAARREEFALAIRTVFAAAAALLDVRGVLHDDASATVNDLRRQLRDRGPSIERPFVDLARAYTATAYAELPATSAMWAAANEAFERLSTEAQS